MDDTGTRMPLPRQAKDDWADGMQAFLDHWEQQKPEQYSSLSGACTFMRSALSATRDDNPWAAVDGLMLALTFYAAYHNDGWWEKGPANVTHAD